jgi:NAD-dependent deacetylase
LELHGSIWTVRCIACGSEAHDERLEFPQMPPRCRACGGGSGSDEALLRPGVVWFGEGLPSEVWRAAEQACRRADVVLMVGTSAVVYPAASLAPLAKRAGAKVVEINPDETPLSREVDAVLRGAAGTVLPQLCVH